MKKKKSPVSIEQAQALLLEYQEHQRRGSEINSRVRSTVKLLGLDQNGYYASIGTLKEALADFAVSKIWPPRVPKEEKGK